VRGALHEAVELKNFEFNAQGVELNQRYVSGAVIADGTGEVWRRDRQLYLQATTRPGAKLPHAWLVDEHGDRVSTLDVTGRGRFSLVTGLAGRAWERAAQKLDLPFLRTVIIGGKGAEDPYCTWPKLRETHEAGALLVRPDGYVAWRHGPEMWDDEEALRLLRDALTSVLARAAG
jgi:2,4-dichlorophenol 6-monooxygenase